MSILHEKIAIITGGSQSLGLAIAQAFAREGARLLLVARHEEKLAAAAEALRKKHGVEVDICAGDLLDAETPVQVVKRCQERFGAADVLVNSFGYFLWKKFLEVSAEDWNRVLNTNLTAPFLMSQAVAKMMIGNEKGGAVINIASIHGAVPDGSVVPQCATKMGLTALSQSMAEALRPQGIRVNAISPGAIRPDSGDTLSSGLEEKITQRDVAELAVYLASDSACGITGANVEAFGVTRPKIAAP